jgi:hypothetical protein
MCRRAILRLQTLDLSSAFELFWNAVFRQRTHRQTMLDILDTLINEGTTQGIGQCGILLLSGPINAGSMWGWGCPEDKYCT